jgi:hypothetical protein
MTADPLKVEHHICEVLIIDLLSLSLMSNRPILAKDAAEIAVREEDGAGAVLAHQGDLLAKMRLSSIDYNVDRGPAESSFTIEPLGSTLAGTELTLLEHSVGSLDPSGQLTFSLQVRIGGTPLLYSFLRSEK